MYSIQFNRITILRDFKSITAFCKHYNLNSMIIFRGANNRDTIKGVPDKYLINTQQCKERVFIDDGIALAQNLDDATHILSKTDKGIVLSKKKRIKK